MVAAFVREKSAFISGPGFAAESLTRNFELKPNQ
jgi:hypothetical protein